MKKLIVLVAMMLMASTQVWGADVDYSSKPDNIRSFYARMTFSNCSVANTLSIITGDRVDEDKLKACEVKLDKMVKEAIDGDDAIYDGLMSRIGDSLSSNNTQGRRYAERYQAKIQMAQQRVIMKSKQ